LPNIDIFYSEYVASVLSRIFRPIHNWINIFLNFLLNII
jgi:hypothetical protein